MDFFDFYVFVPFGDNFSSKFHVFSGTPPGPTLYRFDVDFLSKRVIWESPGETAGT